MQNDIVLQAQMSAEESSSVLLFGAIACHFPLVKIGDSLSSTHPANS
jgi:hypothetical protein